MTNPKKIPIARVEEENKPMTYKLYRCGSKYTGNANKLTFLEKSEDRISLVYRSTIEANTLLSWTISEPISYGFRSKYGEPDFAISTHKETT